MAVYSRNPATEALSSGIVPTIVANAQPQIIGISGLFTYDTNGDLVPVGTTTGTDSVFELNGGGDLQPKI